MSEYKIELLNVINKGTNQVVRRTYTFEGYFSSDFEVEAEVWDDPEMIFTNIPYSADGSGIAVGRIWKDGSGILHVN